MKYKNFNVPDAEVDKLVDTLDISIADACELWLADNGKIVNEEQEKANKIAETAPRRYEQGAKPRKKSEKPRKVNENKAELLEIIKKALFESGKCCDFEQFNEVDLHFYAFDKNYTVKLTEHRKKK